MIKLTRSVLWVAVFCGFAVNYMNRISINIAIVSMVVPPKHDSNTTSVCYRETRSNVTTNVVSAEKLEQRFKWDEKEQNQILGGFYWLHWVLQIPGGILARRFGTKLVFGLSNVICSLLLFVMPAAAHSDYRILVFIRVLQGLISGVAWPSMHNMAAQWTPPNERSKFVSAYIGSSIGIAITYPFCGYLITHFGWESVFYVTGTIGMIWYFGWLYYAYDSPACHPRIDESERQYIEKKIGRAYNTEKLEIPWKELLTSWPVWVAIIGQWGSTWGLFTLMTQSPTYFRHIIGLDVTMTGITSGIPHLLRSIFAICFASLSDYLVMRELVTCTNVRKIASAVAMLGQGIFVIILPLCGCNSTAAVLMLVFAIGIHGAYSTGPLANLVDLSPNFAGVTQGLSGTVGISTGSISAYIVGLLTYQNQTLDQWRKVYLLTAAILISTGVLNIYFSTSNVQDWNSPKAKKEEKELEHLKQES